jgi:acylphosphatase
MPIACSIRITGQVQGVFFREWTVRIATSLGVTGWVRNREDGSVEVHAIGEPRVIDHFVRELRAGPSSAQVDDVAAEPCEPEQPTGFVRRATV